MFGNNLVIFSYVVLDFTLPPRALVSAHAWSEAGNDGSIFKILDLNKVGATNFSGLRVR